MQEILTVTALNSRIRDLLEEGFDTLWVEGEVSNLRRPASGHVYFTLKDDRSQIRAVLFRPLPFQRAPARFDLEEGMQVVCRARLGVYLPRGEYQLIVEGVEPKGLGALQKAFEQLKARLQAEGLFDPARKKPLPFLPRRIGVVTSPTGAVIRDILQVTGRRFPSVDILVAPVRVQGPEAPPEIVRALNALNALGQVDVILLARGGGSLEDLAPFNDETVARAVAASRIPVISAVGHETDVTIADFVADLRAPTPSAAAEMAVPSRDALRAAVFALAERLRAAWRQGLAGRRSDLSQLAERIRDPQRRLADLRIRLDEHQERLRGALVHGVVLHRHRLRQAELQLLQRDPGGRIRRERERLRALSVLLGIRVRGDLEGKAHRLQAAAAVLESLSPLAVLARGYALVRRLPEGGVVTDASVLAPGTAVDVRLRRGSFQAAVSRIDLPLERGKEGSRGERPV